MNSLLKKLKRSKVKISIIEKPKPKPEIEKPVIEKPEIDYIVIEKPINKINKKKVEIEQPLVIVSYDPNDTTLYL